MIYQYLVLLGTVGGWLFSGFDNRFPAGLFWSGLFSGVVGSLTSLNPLHLLLVVYGYVWVILVYDSRYTETDNNLYKDRDDQILKPVIGGVLLVVFVGLGVLVNIYYRLRGYPDLGPDLRSGSDE